MGIESFNKPEKSLGPSELLRQDTEDYNKRRDKAIAEAKDFDDLYSVLHKFKDLPGSQKNYNAEDLVDMIDEVREGTRDIGYITRTSNLRGKVEELLNTKKRTS